MEVHSLLGHEFDHLRSPQGMEPDSSVFESRITKLKQFCFKGKTGWRFAPSHYKDVIEIMIPEIFLVKNQPPHPVMPKHSHPVSSQLLVKALEIVDEVLKSHCEQFASTGIYSLNDMLHVIPCPIEYGDRDERVHDLPTVAGLGGMIDDNDYDDDNVLNTLERRREEEDEEKRSPSPVQLPDDCICVFTIDACIQSTLTSDMIRCPKCGPLDLQSLAPDLVCKMTYV